VARDLTRQICQSRESGLVARIGVAGSYPQAAVGTATVGTGETGAIHQRSIIPKATGGVSRVAKAVTGGSNYGPEDTSARAWARWMSKRSNSTSKTSDGAKDDQGVQDYSAHRALSRL